ncbi:hypothetical protein ACJMK2_030805 [Sinanodonta woodiana]|uniref:Tetratricopeptide repeat protein 6 n=1 Tax=Sinanodonta woodiana TaxID=1069815 RepID=A0ABD3WYK6_SINWO
MARREIYPSFRDERRSFRHGTNRSVELMLRQELDDLARKTVSEITDRKEHIYAAPVSNEVRTARMLRPAFKPQKVVPERKRKPVFHQDLLTKELKEPSFLLVPDIPPYNPLDKDPAELLGKTRKYPFIKEDTHLTSELKKPRVTALGILPVKESHAVPGLQVVMEGKPVAEARDITLEEMVEANKLRPPTPGTPEEVDTGQATEGEGEGNKQEEKKKPAILASVGTTTKLMLTARPPPYPPTTRTPRRRKTSPMKNGRITGMSVASTEIMLPDESVYRQYDDIIAEMDVDLENVQTAVGEEKKTEEIKEGRGSVISSAAKSVQAMLEEARKIASPDAPPIYQIPASPKKKEKKSAAKKTLKEKTKAKGKDKEEEGTKEKAPRGERTVDEIISSLRSQSRSGELSEADRMIQDIMDRVMSRTSGGSMTNSPDTKKASEADQDVNEDTYTTSTVEGTVTSPSKSPSTSGDGLSSPYDEDEGSGDKRELEVPDAIKEEEEVDKVKSEDKDETATREAATQRMTSAGREHPTHMTSVSGPPVVEPLVGIGGDTDEEEEDGELMDIKKAYEDLLLPPNATYEDLISIKGKQLELEGRNLPLPGFKVPQKVPSQSSSVSFLSTWKPVAEREKPEREEKPPESSRNIHHFCTVTQEYQLPREFWHVGRKYHTPGKYHIGTLDQPYRFGSWGPENEFGELHESAGSHASHVNDVKEEQERRLSAAARRVLQEVEKNKDKEGEDTLEAWQQRAEAVFEQQPEVLVEGTAVSLHSDESRLYWTPAPAKLDVAPAKVKEILFPDYQPATMGPEAMEMQEVIEEEEEESSEEEEELKVKEEDRERILDLERTLGRKYSSCEDLTEYVRASRQNKQDIKEGKIFPYAKRKRMKSEIKEDAARAAEAETEVPVQASVVVKREMSDSEIFPEFPRLPRWKSCVDFTEEFDDTLMIPQDYNLAMEEIDRQKSNICQMKMRQIELTEQTENEEEKMEGLQRMPPEMFNVDSLKLHTSKTSKKDEMTPAEKALAAGRAYVILPKRKKKKHRGPVSMARLDEVERFLRHRPRKIRRRHSMIRIAKPMERELRVPVQVREGRKHSLPDILNFQEYGNKKGLKPDYNVREWVRDIWNTWFDEVFPPTPEDSEESEIEEIGKDQKEELKTKRKASISSSIPENLEYIEPLVENEENLDVLQILHEELEKLTEEMKDKPRAFDYCRRGALHRKLGYIKKAEKDLNKAIELEPMLIDAYWHRHLLFVLQDKKAQALEDLTFILKHSKQHSGAYRSMAEIYRRQGDITMAIVNYTQAIKLNPKDHEAYFQRAEMYEKRGDMLLALEDYGKATKIMPTRTDAILKHGMYYFEIGSWNNAINDFSDLLRVDPLNAEAHVLRGRAYANMGQWSLAVGDLSAAIHLNPNHWKAFYHRACILRKAYPKRALHDYSVSLLICDTDENVMSYLHRGILYNSMGRAEDAVPDFESVLKLNKDVACAHVNLGLILMHRYENYHRAIKKFTAAIKVDPTYVRAYVCRAEAFHKIHELSQALKDFTRAIHLRPDVHHYYMYRGQLVLEMGNFELASFCVRHASELQSDSATLGQRPTQQAVVQSFLKNYDKAIEALETATRSKPTAAMFMLLGKTQMKAKNFKDSIKSFERALDEYKPYKPRDSWPIEAADSHYLIGICHQELGSHVDALEAFSNAIKLNPNYAEALYQRGISRMKMKLSKGIQDFNRALAINPKIFQAYLSRACYYGMKNLYTKAILNCNEAIKLQPQSVRAYLYRGALKYHIKAYELAILDLTKATGIDSTCPLAYFNRAVCYQESKQYGKALTDYGIVLLLGEELKIKVLINRGLLYFERKDYINALYDFKLAAVIDPHNHNILHTLGLCYHKLNQLKDAVEVFTKCIHSNQFFLDGIIARGNVHMDFGSKEGLMYARRDYERALKLDPMCLPARVNLAYTLQVSGKFMQAWKHFTIAISIKPNFKSALEGRAVINLQMSDTFAAFQDINAAIKVSATAELLTNRGVINQFMDDCVNAMKDYQAALEIDPTYALAYFNAANVYFHTRHFRQALDYYTKAVQHNSKDESAFLNRAITKVMLRDAKGALEDFKTAISLSPYSLHMYLNRGNLYASMQQHEKAEKDYSAALALHPDDPYILKRRADIRGKLGMRQEAIEDYKQAIEIQSRMRKEC